MYVYKVVQLWNGRFWSPHYPRGQRSVHACMMWGHAASTEKIRRDVDALSKQHGVATPSTFYVKTVHAEIVETD